MRALFLILVLVAIAGAALALEPRIVTITPRAVHGDEVTLTGCNLGSHTLDIEWNGEWIEAQAVGTDPDTRAGWSHLYQGQGLRDKISTTRAWSGTKSMDLSVDKGLPGSSWESTLNYRHDAPFDSIYAVWWSYLEPVEHNPGQRSYSQLKYVAVTCDDCNANQELASNNNLLYASLHYEKVGNAISEFQFENFTWNYCPGVERAFTAVFADAVGIGYQIPGIGPPQDNYWRPYILRGATSNYDAAKYAMTTEGWSRNELYAWSGTGPDEPDGELMFAITKPGQGRFIGHNTSGVVLQTDRTDCRSIPEPWQRFVFYLLFEDTTQGGGAQKFNTFIDDVYLQFGTAARVEIGNAPIYSACSQLEVQIPTAWAADEVTIDFNAGNFNRGQWLWAYVTNDSLDVNAAGKPIWHGSSAPPVIIQPGSPKDPDISDPPSGGN